MQRRRRSRICGCYSSSAAHGFTDEPESLRAAGIRLSAEPPGRKTPLADKVSDCCENCSGSACCSKSAFHGALELLRGAQCGGAAVQGRCPAGGIAANQHEEPGGVAVAALDRAAEEAQRSHPISSSRLRTRVKGKIRQKKARFIGTLREPCFLMGTDFSSA
jgi:hypothetical protein